MADRSKLLLAAELLNIKAVKLQPEQPFTWASGWKSPFYCDNRKTLSFPELRTRVKLGLANLILNEFPEADIVAGVATGAIAQGALVAEELAKPFVYVRPKAKDHGMGNQIEGEIEKGAKVVVVEDLISTGGSSLKAVAALREYGVEVVGMVASFTYGFGVAAEAFENAGVKLITLTNYEAVVEAAKLHQDLADDILALVHESEKTGEPIMRTLEYNDPHKGYAGIVDQFMLGDRYLIAPVLEQGKNSRIVHIPEGKWKRRNVYEM